MEVVLRTLTPPSPSDDVEVVEHKGIGHPDTICDALAESFGVALAQHYRDRFGSIQHFNVDKALLSGGQATPAFGGGEVTAPIRIFLAGRATERVGAVSVPVREIAVEAGKAWIRRHIRALDPVRHVEWNCLVHGGSRDLVELFDAGAAPPSTARTANDTSIGVGFAPFSVLERTVLAASQRLRSLAVEHPFVGEDVKVMGLRRGAEIGLTVACALVGRHLATPADYAVRCAEIAAEVAKASRHEAGRDVAVRINAADDLAMGRMYLTVTGTSAEAGDDGQVGRGNRVNGLITPHRPMSLEAAAGKNPASHVGRLYNVAAHRMATSLVERVEEVEEAHCLLLSRIGSRIDDPVLADVRVRAAGGALSATGRDQVTEIVHGVVASISALTDEMLAGGVRVF